MFLNMFCFSQIKMSSETDLTLDYYRGAGITFFTAEITNYFTHKPFLSGVVGIIVGCGQGLILERGNDGKIVSCMGAAGLGNFAFIIHNNNKNNQIGYTVDEYDNKIVYKKMPKKWSFRRLRMLKHQNY